jgi:hypothetical protein
MCHTYMLYDIAMVQTSGCDHIQSKAKHAEHGHTEKRGNDTRAPCNFCHPAHPAEVQITKPHHSHFY